MSEAFYAQHTAQQCAVLEEGNILRRKLVYVLLPHLMLSSTSLIISTCEHICNIRSSLRGNILAEHCHVKFV